MKNNVDGASNPSLQKASAWDVLRDKNGAWLGGFSYQIGCCEALQAELWAMIKGLEFVWQKNCSKVIIETDSKTMVKWIDKVEEPNAAARNLVQVCWNLMDQN